MQKKIPDFGGMEGFREEAITTSIDPETQRIKIIVGTACIAFSLDRAKDFLCTFKKMVHLLESGEYINEMHR